MATSTTKQNEATEAPVGDQFADQTVTVRSLLTEVAESVVSMSDAVKAIAVVIVDIRASIVNSRKSKKTEKYVQVPDWDGRSVEYRKWRDESFAPMVAELIPEEYRATIETRIQNAVQNEIRAKGRSTPAQRDHLGLKSKTKGQTQQDKRNSDKKKAERPTDEAFEVDSLVEYVKTAPDPSNDGQTVERPIREAAQGIAAMSRALADRSRNMELTKAELKATDAFLVQGINSLILCRMHLGAVESHEEAVAEVTA